MHLTPPGSHPPPQSPYSPHPITPLPALPLPPHQTYLFQALSLQLPVGNGRVSISVGTARRHSCDRMTARWNTPSASARKGQDWAIGAVVHHQLNMNQQCHAAYKTASASLGCISRSRESSSQEVVIPLSTVRVSVPRGNCNQVGAPHFRRTWIRWNGLREGQKNK